MRRKFTAILIDAGLRGTKYMDIMAKLSDRFEVIAVAEPIESRRSHIKSCID